MVALLALSPLACATLTARIQVTDQVSQVVSDVNLQVVGPQGSPYRPLRAVTDKDGNASIALPGAGVYCLYGNRSDMSVIERRIFLAEKDSGVIDLPAVIAPPGADHSLQAYFIDQSTCVPLMNVSVKGLNDSMGPQPTAIDLTSNENGGIELSMPTLSTWPLTISIEGYVTRTEKLRALGNAPGSTILILPLVPGDTKPTPPVKPENPVIITNPTVPTKPVKREKVRLDGIIRQVTKDRIEVGKKTTVSVGYLYFGGTNPNSTCRTHVVIKGPDGAVIADDKCTESLSLTSCQEHKYDVIPALPGTYTVKVYAQGEGKSVWAYTYKFVANGLGGAPPPVKPKVLVVPGVYVSPVTASQVLMTFTGANLTMIGSVAPATGKTGSRLSLKGRWNMATNRLEAKGVDLDNRAFIRLLGSVDANGRITLTIRFSKPDYSPSRTLSYQLAKK